MEGEVRKSIVTEGGKFCGTFRKYSCLPWEVFEPRGEEKSAEAIVSRRLQWGEGLNL